MLLVRQVARPDGALLCAVELLPDGALRQDTRRDAAGSAGCSPEGALLCAVKLLPDGAVRFPCRQLLPDGAVLCAVELLPDGAVRFPCRQLLPDGATSASAERQPLPHILPLRSIPPAALRLRAPPIHEGHGRPRSVRKSSRLRWKHHLPSCSFARPGCSLIRPRCTRLLAKPEYFPAE